MSRARWIRDIPCWPIPLSPIIQKLRTRTREAASEALKEQKIVCPVLAKPFELDELERALGKMLAH